MALTTGLFVFFCGKISAQEQDVVQYGIASTSSLTSQFGTKYVR